MLDVDEQERLKGLYERLRIKLLDLSKRNRMLNYPLGARSKRHIQIVDVTLDWACSKLLDDEASLRIAFLEQPEGTPKDEKTQEFMDAFEHAKVSDVEHLTALEGLINTGRDDEIAVERLESYLRDRVRTTLGLPPRLKRSEINRAEHARSLGIDPNPELKAPGSNQSDGKKALQTLKYPDELEAIMEKLSDEARLAEQESGLSTLFLAFGFLEWYESDDSDKPLYAPLLLLPTKIERQTIKGKEVYFVAAHESSMESNISLRKLLEKEFNCTLPEFESDDADQIGSIEGYFAKVRESIDGLKRWQVRRWFVLGHFAFSRIVMFEDTKPERWSIDPTQSGLVGPLLKGYEEAAEGEARSFLMPEDYEIDHPEIERLAPILIHDADASQHSALVDVMKSKNLVLQGPPGTGKSQTITNIIANALAQGKTVLFLSEKQAALDVVKRRLDMAGLGDFCLELHSDKSSPKSIIQSLDRRYQLGTGKTPKNSDTQSDTTWIYARKQIAEYVGALHTEAQHGATPFKLIWKSIRDRAAHADIQDILKAINIPASFLENVAEINLIRGQLDIFATSAQSFEDAHGRWILSPWRVTMPGNAPAYAHEEMLDAIFELRQATADRLDFLDSQAALGIFTTDDADHVVAADASLPDPPDMATVAAIFALDLDGLEHGLALQWAFLDAKAVLAELPPSDGVDASILPRASKLMSLAPQPELLELTPSEVYRHSESCIQQSRLFLESIDALRSAMSALCVNGSAPVHLIEAVAAAVELAAKIDAAYRPWIGATHIDEEPFASFHAQWMDLLQEENALREIIPNAGAEAWPAATDLSVAAEELRKTGFAKLIGAVFSKAKLSKKILEQLKLDQPPQDTVKILDRLGVHLRAIEIFDQNPEAASALGYAWQGVTTRFDEIDGGIQWRRYIESTISQLPGGDRVASAMIALQHEQLATLAEHETAAGFYHTHMEMFRDILDQTPIDTALARHRDVLAAYQCFLESDADQVLARSELTVAQLAEIDVAQARVIKGRAAIDASPLADAVRSFAPGKVEIAKVSTAIAWVRSLRRYHLPASISEGLLSPDAARWRDTLRKTANRYSEIETRRRRGWEAVEPFALQGLDAFDQRSLVTHLDSLLVQRDALAAFLTLGQQRDKLESAGLKDFLQKTEAAELSPSRLPEVLDATITRLQALTHRRTSRPLSQHTGNDLDAYRKTFADRDRRKILVDREMVKARLLAKQPPFGAKNGSVKTWTHMCLLNNEFQKQKAFVPVRRLLERAGEAIGALKPCFMMSPLSLAKFMPPGAFQFDLLVIDEASQMRPEDALGAMLRSKQIVVVGDPKQLPPTNFFDRSEANPVSEDEGDDIDDESILERCQKVFDDVRRLKWHYRSRCESLIRFSNEEFYEKSLITFPAAKPDSFSIDLIRVDGTYKASLNVAEAERVAEEAIEFMRYFSGSDEASIPTLGIVAINMNQKDLIQETLRRLSAGDDLVTSYMEKIAKKGEPLFVKNLENVQGDERDFIFISMTYGREPGGSALMQRFGPINSKQGHRRLNVLFSRARIRIGLFTSFGSDDIKPTEGSKDGVHVLKRYLEYAETRGRAPVQSIGGEPDSDFEIEVAERLRRMGFQVDLQIGVSGFKIDLGVRHPDHPEMFLAGIECDGASYHSSKSARDRDRLREEVLHSLGWKLLRVWSTDWFDNPDAQTEKLGKRLKEMRERPIAAFQDYQLNATYASEDGEIRIDEPVAKEVSDAESKKRGLEELASPAAVGVDMEAADSYFEGTNVFGPLTEAEAFMALTSFRETVIRPAATNWQAHRSILRDGMIETFIRQRITDPNDWFKRVPQYLRSGTDPTEKRMYLEQICATVERVTKATCATRPSPSEDGFRMAKSRAPSGEKAQFSLPLDS
jgi:very-short-patch-repair endonuclease